MKRGALTIAFGSDKYIEMGEALGMSLRLGNPDLPLAVVTDDTSGRLAKVFDHVIPLNRDYGEDVAQKLFVDVYSPFDATLFIDCDCLAFGSLDYVFEGMLGGKTIIPDKLYYHDRENPKYCTDFDQLEAKTGFDKIPGFNGGAYYIERGTTSERIFQKGREILVDHDAYGVGIFRTTPPDEIVLAVAMLLTGYDAHDLPKHVMRETIGLTGDVVLDSLNQKASLQCFGINYDPSIVHFCTGYRESDAYPREMKKVRILYSKRPLSRLQAKVYNDLAVNGPKIWSRVPKPIRLTYHAIHSRLRPSKR